MKPRLLFLFLFWAIPARIYAYRIITPEPFSIAGKNYLKLQVLSETGDPMPDSVFFDVLYNTGSVLVQRVDSSLSCVLTLNAFNDGVFYVRARVYHAGRCDTLGSKYDPAGIPVLLDRHPGFNETNFLSAYLSDVGKREVFLRQDSGYAFTCNNNKARFSSCWDNDSLYFFFQVKDAQLNDTKPGYIDLFQARHYLKTLWNSDCIEIGFDLRHDRSAWKERDDYELLADVKGNYIGNRWSVDDSLYTNWGQHTRVSVERSGTVNDNSDLDEGYSIRVSIPWEELEFKPVTGQAIGFDIQLYDKDGEKDEAFRTSISGTNPESNDNTSEWTSLVFTRKSSSSYNYLFLLGFPLLAMALYLILRKRKKTEHEPAQNEEAVDNPPQYSESIEKALRYIAQQYQEPELSRQQIAEHVFLSEKYLSSLFKKEVGTNLVSYINHYRVERSIELLKDTRLSISEIAFKVGFNSLQNFNKNFKSFTQRSPSDYRRG